MHICYIKHENKVSLQNTKMQQCELRGVAVQSGQMKPELTKINTRDKFWLTDRQERSHSVRLISPNFLSDILRFCISIYLTLSYRPVLLVGMTLFNLRHR